LDSGKAGQDGIIGVVEIFYSTNEKDEDIDALLKDANSTDISFSLIQMLQINSSKHFQKVMYVTRASVK